MSDPIVDYLEQLSLDELKLLDSACAALRESIENGTPRSLESFLDGIAEPKRSIMLLELIGSEIETKLEVKSELTVEDYVARYPQLADELPSLFAERCEEHARSKSSASQPRRTTRDAEQMVGRWLGHYKIQSVIGYGGMGFVLAAMDTKLGREVALKLASPHPLNDEAAIASFIREAKVAAEVRHENIVTIHSVEEQGAQPFIVMERIEGLTLEEYVKKHGPMRPAEVMEVGLQIANGLAAAHAVGLTHHDIKPSNILLESQHRRKGFDTDARTESVRVKLTDFGLAQSVSNPGQTLSPQVAGTPMYMSPEQASGSILDARSDLFSLGSVLYFLTSGRPPFAPGAVSVVLRQVIECQPASLRSMNPAIPEALSQLIRELMSKAPNDRPSSADEVIQRLRVLQQNGLSNELSKPRLKRHDLAKFGLGLTVVMLVLLCAVVWFAPRRIEEAKTAMSVASLNSGSKNSTSRSQDAAWSLPMKVPFVDGDSSGSNPTLTGDGLRLVFVRRYPTGAKLVEAKRESIDEPFSVPQLLQLTQPSNESNIEEQRIGTPSLSANGLMLTFYRMCLPGRADLWSAHRESLDAPWQPMIRLDEVCTPYHEFAPCISRDGLQMFWFHESPEFIDNADIWTATRATVNDTFSGNRRLNDAVNSATNEHHPYVTADGAMLYFDRGTPEPRMWLAHRDPLTGDFSQAVRVALPESWNDINAYAPTLTSDGRLLLFTSNEVPGRQGFETGVLWQSLLVP